MPYSDKNYAAKRLLWRVLRLSGLEGSSGNTIPHFEQNVENGGDGIVENMKHEIHRAGKHMGIKRASKMLCEVRYR
jgi:hypothetical protein